MNPVIRPRRSVLYMPGINQRAMEKAGTLDVDAVILDLEDAVAPDRKEEARGLVCERVAQRDYGYREVVIRVNGEGTPWHEADIVAAAKACPDAILVPKVEDASMAQRCLKRIGAGGPCLWVMIETPAGIANVDTIAAVEGVDVLVMGTSDLIKEFRITDHPERLPLLYSLSRTVAAARRYGCDALDGVTLDLKDLDALEKVCRQGRDLGFDGKPLIHPPQVGPANAIFGPDLGAVSEAKEVVVAWEKTLAEGKGVAVLNGRMIENLHAEQARRVVAFAHALETRKGDS